MPEGCMLYLNYCYREHFKILLTSDIQFQPLFQESLISLEQDLVEMCLLLPNRISICVLLDEVFSRNLIVDFCQNKREQLFLLTSFFGFSVYFQALLASFRGKQNQTKTKNSNPLNKKIQEENFAWTWYMWGAGIRIYHRNKSLNIYSVSQQTPCYKVYFFLFPLHRQAKLFQRSILTYDLKYQ